MYKFYEWPFVHSPLPFLAFINATLPLLPVETRQSLWPSSLRVSKTWMKFRNNANSPRKKGLQLWRACIAPTRMHLPSICGQMHGQSPGSNARKWNSKHLPLFYVPVIHPPFLPPPRLFLCRVNNKKETDCKTHDTNHRRRDLRLFSEGWCYQLA